MSKARILIMHPEPSALTLLSSMLKTLGHEIDEAANDRVAVRLMERGGVDLMLAGVDPADVEAPELLSYMRRKHRQVPVLLLSSSPTPERAKDALRQGALAVLRYPMPANALRAAVMQVLAPRGVSAHPAAAEYSAPSPAAAQYSPCGSAHSNACATGGGNQASPPVATTHGAPRAEQLARELGIVGHDPSLRQAI